MSNKKSTQAGGVSDEPTSSGEDVATMTKDMSNQRSMSKSKKGDSVMSDQAKSISGLTDEQALEFHEQFKVTFTTFMVLAAVAHGLVYVWRPWF